MKLLKLLPILVLLIGSCKKEVTPRLVSYKGEGTTSNFIMSYIGSDSVNTVKVRYPSVVVHPFTMYTGDTIMVAVASIDAGAKLAASMYVDGALISSINTVDTAGFYSVIAVVQ